MMPGDKTITVPGEPVSLRGNETLIYGMIYDTALLSLTPIS